MQLSDFDFDLPKEFIAQDPVSPRDNSKLLVLDTVGDEVLHKQFFNLKDFLRDGDVLVVNTSKVIPARILFDWNGGEREIFILKNLGEDRYQSMVRPGKAFKLGVKYDLNDCISCVVKEVLDDGTRVLKFFLLNDDLDLEEELEKVGQAPFPPYITESTADFSQYQTVYSLQKGSVAAPTAGLHFTNELLDDLRAMGVAIEEVVLHVGRGTFLPVNAEDIKDHVMHEEFFEFSEEVADRLNIAKAQGRRIIAVGTTSVRVLESCCDDKGIFSAKTEETDIFIYPGYKWKAVDGLVTNFHLPKSTLIMLVAALLDDKGVNEPVKKILDLYEIAKKENYRFYSFGDAMVIL